MKGFTLFTAFVLTHITALTSAAAIAPRDIAPGDTCLLDNNYACQWSLMQNYTFDSETNFYETPGLSTGLEVGPDPAGGAITASYSYSRSYSVSVNFAGVVDPNKFLSDISGNVGVIFGFSVTITKGTGVSGTENCPAGAVCGLTASAHVLNVTGSVYQRLGNWCNGDWYSATTVIGDTGTQGKPFNGCALPPEYVSNSPFNQAIPYQASFPILSPSSLVDGQDSMETLFTVCAVFPFPGLTDCPPGYTKGVPTK